MRQTTLRLDENIYRAAKADAAGRGVTLSRYLEEALQSQLKKGKRRSSTDRERVNEDAPGAAGPGLPTREEVAERDALMEKLLRQTSRFRIGPKPTREEMNER